MYSASFEVFWKAYPRKVAKLAAWRIWDRMKPPLEDILKALEWQRRSDQWTKSGGIYIPHPATYLNQGRWEDEPDIPISETPRSIMGIAPSKTGRQMVY